ncbi:MAG: hypothetical protein LLF95_04180 [Bacteroidales bacterium]|nr:hypothetical protein [Bacteroidales bacterium]
MNRIIVFVITGFISIGLASCGKNKRFEVNPDSEKIEVKIKRFDRDLVRLDTSALDVEIQKLYKQYPQFMPVYVSDILGVNPNDTVEVRKLIYEFLSDTAFQSVNRKTLETFNDVSAIEQSISTTYSYIRHYFPEIKLPEVYFFVSGFNRSIMLNDNFVGIGTDLYLGSDYTKYTEFSYQYLTYNMRPESVSPDIISALLFKSFPFDCKEERLLDNMLYRGKVMFLLSVVMPGEKPNDLMGYSKRQWEWSRKYEKEIWETIVDQKDLFSTDVMLIRKYLNDAPFTTPVSQDSPGRLGTWVGWQIVRSYMDNNKDVGLADLMKDNNYQKIFDKSGYMP